MALLIAVAAALFWPGLPMYDTIAQYRQVLGHAVDDWHPPVMVRLWQLLYPLAAGTAPLFVLQVALYAAGFALIAAALVRKGRTRAGVAAGIVALSPLLLGWQMVVLKDEQMLGALLAAVGIVAHYRLDGCKISPTAAVLAAILLAYATLVRANAVFATAPLAAFLLPTRERPILTAGITVASTAAVLALAPVVNHDLLRAEPSDVAKSEPLFDLAGIAVRTSAGAASPFNAEERAEILKRRCVQPFFWDSLADPQGCEEATERVQDQSARRLYGELARAALAHPVAYAAHRAAHWNSTERWFVPPGLPEASPPDEAERNDLRLIGPSGAAAPGWQRAAAIEAGTPLGWPIAWTVIAALLLPAAWRRRWEPAGSIALALVASVLTLEASFLLISIASDLRYHLWSMAASTLALILLSDGLRPSRTSIFPAAVLALVIGGGLAARWTLPTAPDSYEAMVRTPSG